MRDERADAGGALAAEALVPGSGGTRCAHRAARRLRRSRSGAAPAAAALFSAAASQPSGVISLTPPTLTSMLCRAAISIEVTGAPAMITSPGPSGSQLVT